MPGVSVCKLCSASVLGLVPTRAAELVNFGRKSYCSSIEISSGSSSFNEAYLLFGQPECSMRAALYSTGARWTHGKVIRPTNLYSVGKLRDLASRASFTSLSKGSTLPLTWRLKKLLHKPEGRLPESDVAVPEVKNLALKVKSSAPDSTTTTSTSTTAATSSLPAFLSQRGLPVNLAAGVGVTAAVFMMAFLGFLAKPRRNGSGGGSMADLIRRGQIRSDRGADSELLNYEDPFNNPLVKMGSKNPIVKMCGKMFRLAPVTLTDEKVVKHQNRRIQAYKWKRPTVFLSDGDSVPDGVDPEEVRWIPSNHPFATTSNYIDEDLAQKNVYQTRGVPSRVRAEHDALRKKMEATSRKEQDFQPPNMEFGGEQAWKTNRTSAEDGSQRTDMVSDQGQAPDSTASLDKESNVKGGNSSSAVNGQSQAGGSSSGETGSRLRTIDFS